MAGKYNRKDHYYEKAKSSGYRSRAAFKLIELDRKYKLLKRGARVIDLGSWPGGWLQVASERVGSHGRVVGIDLKAIDKLEANNVRFVVGDVGDEQALRSALKELDGNCDLVVSDMSPKLSGIKEVDGARSGACGELALYVATQVLKPGGSILMKLFTGADADDVVRQTREMFTKVIRTKPDSSRRSSSEFYLLGFDMKEVAE